MKLSAILEPLVDSGVDAATILKAVKAWETQQSDALERRRANDRERQERRRHVKSREVTVTVPSRDAGAARVEDITSNLEITGQEEKTKTTAHKARESDLSEFKAELSDLDSERLEAVVKHRRTKRGQITGLSARLFRRDAQECGLSLAEAVDTCISRNWLTVKPDYLGNRQQRATSPPNGKGNAVDAMNEIFRERGWTTDEPTQFPSDFSNGQRLPAERGGEKGTVVDLREGSWRRTGSGD